MCLSFLPGCAWLAVREAKARMQTTLDSLMGLTEADVVIKLGAPNGVQNVGGLIVYHYYQSYGMRTNIYANGLCGASNVWESYDQFDIMFKDGRAVSWKGYVQR